MKTIIFLGDSITAANRSHPDHPLGTGYVHMISESLLQSSEDWSVFNCAVDGNATEELAKCLRSDCISLRPDYVSILVGINDIAKISLADASQQEKLYMLEDSIRAYHEMLFDLTRESQARVFILEPFLLSKEEDYPGWLPWQQKMSKNIRKLARNYGAYFVPLQDALTEKAMEAGYASITTDGIHLTQQGQQFLAELLQNTFDL